MTTKQARGELMSSQTIPAIREGILAAGDKQIVVLSDFDYTLCGEFGFDEATHNHIPRLTDELVLATTGLHLVIATGRRADNPAIASMWSSGLLPTSMPIISENGGSLVFHDAKQHSYLDLAPSTRASRFLLNLSDSIRDVPEGQKLVLKAGRTMLVAQIQSEADGMTHPYYQSWLASKMRRIITDLQLKVVNTRASVTVQDAAIDKSRGFKKYLDLIGLNRDDIFVVGMGDGPNDEEIFREADLSIGFSGEVSHMVDLVASGGAASAPTVLTGIKKAVRPRLS